MRKESRPHTCSAGLQTRHHSSKKERIQPCGYGFLDATYTIILLDKGVVTVVEPQAFLGDPWGIWFLVITSNCLEQHCADCCTAVI